MTDIFDEVDDILNNVEDEGPAADLVDAADSVENNFNETELHNIIAEIENLEKDFTADVNIDEIQAEIEAEFAVVAKVAEIPKIIVSTTQIEAKKTELQMQIDQELEMALKGVSEAKEVANGPAMIKEVAAPKENSKVLSFEKKPTPEISFEAQGQMNLNLAFKIGEEIAKLTIDPVKGLIITMSGVELSINEIDGCKVTMDSGVKFVIPLITAETALKKKSA